MDIHKKVPINMHCPNCKSQMHADYDMSNFFLDGNCAECGHTVHSYTPHMAEQIQEKMRAKGMTVSPSPNTLQLVPETSSETMQKPSAHKHPNPYSVASPVAGQFVAEDMSHSIHRQVTQDQLETDIYADLDDDDDEKTDVFALLLNISVVILVLVYVTIYTPDGSINWAIILLPFIAMLYVWLSNGKIGLVNITSKQLNTLVLFPVGSALLLTIETSEYSHILDYANFWFPCILVSAIMGGLYYYIGTRNQDITIWEKLLIPACAIAYAYGVVMFVNISFDTSEAISRQVPILAEHREHHYSRYGSSYEWYITIPSVKNHYERTKIQVSEDFYYHIRAGERVVVVQKKGFLEIPWYKVKSTDKAHPLL